MEGLRNKLYSNNSSWEAILNKQTKQVSEQI